ncbi:hypothetical protein JCM6882_005234 [Rhodosporidiobolus microsporus]
MPLTVLREFRERDDFPVYLHSVSSSDTLASVHAQARKELLDEFWSKMPTILFFDGEYQGDEEKTLGEFGIDCSAGKDARISLRPWR